MVRQEVCRARCMDVRSEHPRGDHVTLDLMRMVLEKFWKIRAEDWHHTTLVNMSQHDRRHWPNLIAIAFAERP